jgi:hypothetical protein
MPRFRTFAWLALAVCALAVPAHLVRSQTTFTTPVNNASSVLAADHAAGSGTLVLRGGDGALFGSTFPIRVTVASRATLAGGRIVPNSTRTIYQVTGRTADTLTGLTAIEGTTDRAYRANDPVAALVTAGTLQEVQAAVNANTAAIAPVLGGLSGIVKGSAGTLSAAVAGTDYVAPAGSGSALTVTPAGATTSATLAARLAVQYDAVNDFGAAGDGTTDDTAELQAGIAALKARGGGALILPRGTYLISRPLTLPSNVTLRGLGRGVSTLTKPASVRSLMTANCNAGATSVTVADGSLFAVGNAIHLYDTSNYEWLSTQGQITAKAGNVLTFSNTSPGTNVGANANYQTTRSGAVTTSFPLIRNELASTNVNVQDLTLDGNKGAGDPSGGNVDFTISVVHWEETYRSAVERCELIDSCSDTVSDQANSGRPGTGDGSMKATRNRVQFCRIDGAVRHAVHLGTTMDGAFVEGNEITNCGPSTNGYAVFYCAYATNTMVRGNYVQGCGAGFAGGDDRDSGNSIIANTVRDWTTYGIEFSNAGAGGTTPGRLAINDNIFSSTVGASNAAISCNQPDCCIVGNRIQTGGSYGLALDSAALRCTVAANVITGVQAGGSIGMYIAASDCRLTSNSIHNWANAVEVAGVSRMVALGQHISAVTARAWWFTAINTDCIIAREQNDWFTPVTLSATPVRFVYEGLGDNGSTNPASGGAWNAASGTRWNGTMVRWNSGGGEKVSIFNDGVGWTALN